MDIKSKSIKISGTFITWVLIIVTAISMVRAYPGIWDRTNKNIIRLYESESTLELLKKMSYSLYMDVANKRAGSELTPLEVFAPEYSKDNQNDINEQKDYVGSGDVSSIDHSYSDFRDLPQYINNTIWSWEHIVHNNINVQYIVRDDSTKEIVNSSSDGSYDYYINSKEDIDLKYPFTFQLSYDENGDVTTSNINGADVKLIQNYFGTKDEFIHIIYDYFGYIDKSDENYIKLENPKNMTITFAIPEKITGYDDLYYEYYNVQRSEFLNQGFVINSIISISGIFLIGILLYAIKPLKIGRGFSAKIPFEINIAGIICVPLGVICIFEAAYQWYIGYGGVNSEYFSERQIYLFSYLLHVLLWFLLLGVVMIITLSLLQVFTIGLKRYCKEKVLIIRMFCWLGRKVKSVYHSLITFDFKDKSNKTILKIVGVNFLILLILCSIWVFGIPILIIYSILLYIILKRIYTDVLDKYSYLLKATNRMAEGDLEVKIEEDLGYFEPFKEEIKKIQIGFKKAVEEEVKSQNMKAELITNVSHDLKTPLTAIITYIDLLKDENITEEQRNSYLSTLDQKSQRLKHLIEDLFEISKATSKNIEVNLSEVDLVSLIKQVQYELNDQLKAAGIDLRLQLPEDKVLLNLDGQKIYRIFDNLFVNIAKYSLPNTRAYVELTEDRNKVYVTLKNISAVELNFDAENITERFVRGDKSRNTEGAGLGLAIVKSFMELHGGELNIIVDGDLFKAILVFLK